MGLSLKIKNKMGPIVFIFLVLNWLVLFFTTFPFFWIRVVVAAGLALFLGSLLISCNLLQYLYLLTKKYFNFVFLYFFFIISQKLNPCIVALLKKEKSPCSLLFLKYFSNSFNFQTISFLYVQEQVPCKKKNLLTCILRAHVNNLKVEIFL
jgi:hypothetical protein